MNKVKLIAIFSENKRGQLARATRVLADARVNIRCVTVATSETFGVIKFLVDQYDLAYRRLQEAQFTVSLIEVLAVEVDDQPGGLWSVADCLASTDINVENASGFVARGRAVLLIEVRDIALAQKALEQHSMRCLSQEEMLQI